MSDKIKKEDLALLIVVKKMSLKRMLQTEKEGYTKKLDAYGLGRFEGRRDALIQVIKDLDELVKEEY